MAFCLASLIEAAQAQQSNYFRTRQSGGWNDNIWEHFNGTVWVYPTTAPNALNSNGILIVAGHEVTVVSNVTVDQLRVEGILNVSPGRTLTVANGPDIDLEVDHPNALLRIQGTLVNNGQIRINQGGFQVGSVQNNGSIELGTTLFFAQGNITGNDFVYGPAGSLVINAATWVTLNQDNRIWPATNGPASITIQGNATLVGDRTISGSLNVIGTLHVLGSLTNMGTVYIPGILELTGAYHNNNTTEIPGQVIINTAGTASGNEFVYTGCCSVLEFRGANFTHDIGEGNVFWPEMNPPQTVIIPNNLHVNVAAARSTGRINLGYYATLQASGILTTHDTSTIEGAFLVPGTYINNGAAQARMCEVSGSFINYGAVQFTSTSSTCRVSGALANNGDFLINGTFQLEQGGTISGQPFSYGTEGILVFNNSSGTYQVYSESAFWPEENPPYLIYVKGPGGIVLNAPRAIPSLLQLAAGVHNADNLLISGRVTMEHGGYMDVSPVYSAGATLVYNLDELYLVGPEWAGGTSVGPGVPMHVEIMSISTIVLPDSPRRCPGNLTIHSGELVLGSTPGADLHIGGNWYNVGQLSSNFRQVIFDGTAEQLLRGATAFDYLTIDNPAGVRLWAEYYWDCPFVTVHEALRFTNGTITLGAEDYVCTLALEGAVEGASAGRHVVTQANGYVLRAIGASESFQFPVGPTAASYNPMTVTLPNQASGGLFRVRVDSTILFPEVDASASVRRTWHLMDEIYCEEPNSPHQEGDSILIRLRFQWSAAEEGLHFMREASATYFGEVEYANDPASGTDPYSAATRDSLLYQLGQTFIVSNAGGLTDAEDLSAGDQSDFYLGQNFPNPTPGPTVIRYTTPEAGHVRFSVYDALGRVLERWVDGTQPGGLHEVVWNPSGLPNGMYFYRLQAGAFEAVRKMTVLR